MKKLTGPKWSIGLIVLAGMFVSRATVAEAAGFKRVCIKNPNTTTTLYIKEVRLQLGAAVVGTYTAPHVVQVSAGETITPEVPLSDENVKPNLVDITWTDDINGANLRDTGKSQYPPAACAGGGGSVAGTLLEPVAQPTNCPDCVPTVSEWGLVVMAMLVLTAATVVIMRRRAMVRGGS